MGWLRWVGRSVFLGSVLVAGGAAVNQLLTGDGRLSWSAAYFALVFTVLGVLLDQLPARAGVRAAGTSRRRYLRRVRASAEQMGRSAWSRRRNTCCGPGRCTWTWRCGPAR